MASTLRHCFASIAATPSSSSSLDPLPSHPLASLARAPTSCSFNSPSQFRNNASGLRLNGPSGSLWSLLSLSPGLGRCPQRQPLVCMNLPSGIGERNPSSSISKWSARAIKSFSMAELEARKLKYPTTGTEALLMGILTEGTSQASRFLRANGITLFGVRDETVKLLGKADMYFFSPEHPPLTEPTQGALDWAVEKKSKSGEGGEVTTTHLLLGIWAQKGSAGQQILANLGFDDKKAKELEENILDNVKEPLVIGRD